MINICVSLGFMMTQLPHMIHHLVWYCCVITKKSDESTFLFDESFLSFQTRVFFSGANLTELAMCMYVYIVNKKRRSIYFRSLLSTFLNNFLSNFKLFDSLLRKGCWYTSSRNYNFIHNRQNNIRVYLASYTNPKHQLACYIFWWDKVFSNNIIFTLCITQFLLFNIFSFSWDFSAYQIDFPIFWALNSWIFCVTFHFVQCFCVANFWFL